MLLVARRNAGLAHIWPTDLRPRVMKEMRLWWGMLDRPTCMERAFALAETGSCESLNAIRKQLKTEGYAESGQLTGGSIRNQLMRIIAERKAQPPS
jgi:hypothetical protein